MFFKRNTDNPIFSPKDVTPSLSNLKVDGIFNCAATTYKNQEILLCRVAESYSHEIDHQIKIPVMVSSSSSHSLEQEIFNTKNQQFDFTDSRVIRNIESKKVHRLTSLSHLRIAISNKQGNFELQETPWIFPTEKYEEWGIEDPRITKLNDSFYITYSAISSDGVSVGLIQTEDFVSYKRLGVILPPTNKDAVIFPEKIQDKFYMLHRPVPSDIGNLNIWLSSSENLQEWGHHRVIYRAGTAGAWEADRVGVGPPPIKTPKGWLVIYHAADKGNTYRAGFILLDLEKPWNVLASSREPFIEPQENYETKGFFNNVVFPCGTIQDNRKLKIFYGAADDKVCSGVIDWDDVWKSLGLIS